MCYRVKAPSRIGHPARPELAHRACQLRRNAVVLWRMLPATITLSERALRDNPGLCRFGALLDALGGELKAVAGCVPGVVLTVGTVDIPGGESRHGFLREPGSECRGMATWPARLRDRLGDSGSLCVRRYPGTAPGQLAAWHDDRVIRVARLQVRQRADPLPTRRARPAWKVVRRRWVPTRVTREGQGP